MEVTHSYLAQTRPTIPLISFPRVGQPAERDTFGLFRGKFRLTRSHLRLSLSSSSLSIGTREMVSLGQ